MISAINYYENEAITYFERTFKIDMSEIYVEFFKYLPKNKNSLILDVGSGSGRDSFAFTNLGYKCMAVERSKKLSVISHDYFGISIINDDFLNVEFEEKFDGIWACASLIHDNCDIIKKYLLRFSEVSNNGCVLYSCFQDKYSKNKPNCYINRMEKREILDIFSSFSFIKIKKIWLTNGEGETKGKRKWWNVICIINL